ncbi:hypothetical protein BDW74DRAFT_143277 [Aspergillus multicolor]|uniref:uncharacterized protein n=1 Tax=Aspergillus multicolor TaxID=41759 RepID=UPI003CCD19E9
MLFTLLGLAAVAAINIIINMTLTTVISVIIGISSFFIIILLLICSSSASLTLRFKRLATDLHISNIS